MKRSVAIIGPTPQFVRWAIEHSCPLRIVDQKNLPDATFRQLRGLRELSVGIISGRVMEGICVHPGSTSENPTDAMGFFVTEALDAHGDQEFVGNCCHGCPANTDARDEPGIWAGCYGWLPASNDLKYDSKTISETVLRSPIAHRQPQKLEAFESHQNEMVRLLDDVIRDTGRTSKADSLFQVTSPRWYGIWQSSQFDRHQIKFLLEVFEELVPRISPDATTGLRTTSDWMRFRNALQACCDHSLELHVELIPPGVSDGATWTQFAHCPSCKYALRSGSRDPGSCPACGRIGNAHGERKSKVLGLRPYVKLCGVIGESKTVEFLQRFEARAQRREMSVGSEKSKRESSSESHPSGSSPIEERPN